MEGLTTDTSSLYTPVCIPVYFSFTRQIERSQTGSLSLNRTTALCEKSFFFKILPAFWLTDWTPLTSNSFIFVYETLLQHSTWLWLHGFNAPAFSTVKTKDIFRLHLFVMLSCLNTKCSAGLSGNGSSYPWVAHRELSHKVAWEEMNRLWGIAHQLTNSYFPTTTRPGKDRRRKYRRGGGHKSDICGCACVTESEKARAFYVYMFSICLCSDFLYLWFLVSVCICSVSVYVLISCPVCNDCFDNTSAYLSCQ